MITTPRENATGAVTPAPAGDKKAARRPMRTSLAAHGEPMIWLAGGGLAIAMKDEHSREPALITYLVTASGLTLAGVGAAFWGVVAGALALAVQRLRR